MSFAMLSAMEVNEVDEDQFEDVDDDQ